MPDALALRVLLVSKDKEIIRQLTDTMKQASIEVETVNAVDTAIKQICRKKYEAILIDFKNEDEGLRLLHSQRCATSNKTAVVVGIVNNELTLRQAYRAGANFVLTRPFSQRFLERTLKASYPLLVREKRRYYRAGIRMQVLVKLVKSKRAPEVIANSINLSEGGIALDGAVPMQVGEQVELRFKLPTNEATTWLTAEVCWCDNDGRVGLQFVTVPETDRQQIQAWIACRIEEGLPYVVGIE